MTGKLVTVYWRDIPAQVVARVGRGGARVQLGERFQVAIDRAAMRAGKGTSGAYLEEWRRVAEPFDGDPDEAARIAAERLEAVFDDAALERLVKAGGAAVETG